MALKDFQKYSRGPGERAKVVEPCLACVRPWVQTPVPLQKKLMTSLLYMWAIFFLTICLWMKHCHIPNHLWFLVYKFIATEIEAHPKESWREFKDSLKGMLLPPPLVSMLGHLLLHLVPNTALRETWDRCSLTYASKKPLQAQNMKTTINASILENILA
jgi:hypothetical protein